MRLSAGNIPIHVSPFFWLLSFLIGWINTFNVSLTIIWMAVIFFSVLVHELGHAVTARFFGQSARIEFVAVGGVTHRHGPPIKLWQDFLIVLNGPLAGFSLFLLATLLLSRFEVRADNPFIYALVVMKVVNFFWTIVNLLPIQPLDGGHLLRIALEGVLGLKGVKLAYLVSFLCGALLGLFFFIKGLFLAGAIFFMFTFEGYRQFRSILSLTEMDQDSTLQKQFKQAEEQLKMGNSEVAYRMFQEVRNEAEGGVLYVAATEFMSKILSEYRRYKEAYDLLHPHVKKISPEALRLLHQLAYHTGNWEEAISLGNRTFQYFPSYDTALINALSHSVMGQVEPAIGWLRTSLREGLPNFGEIAGKREFDLIRDEPAFQNLLKEAKE